MSKFHFLNVKQGECKIIQHPSGRVTMKDICNGNAVTLTQNEALRSLQQTIAKSSGVRGNFGMCQYPTNPIDYLDELGIDTVHRFILSHPDMDHMDGFDALFRSKEVLNYWDSGVRRETPNFGVGSPYKVDDWNRYASILNGEEDVKVVTPLAGARFSFANEPEGEHDGLYILSPDENIVDNIGDETNDASYVVLYRSRGGKILMPGDAGNETWKFVLENYYDSVSNCDILVAAHHGRDSKMDFSYLKTVNPNLVLIGCAKCKDLAYEKYKDYNTLTNNQAGNIVAESVFGGGFDIYIENPSFAEAAGRELWRKNSQGYVWYDRI